jgi:hypothetical protein
MAAHSDRLAGPYLVPGLLSRALRRTRGDAPRFAEHGLCPPLVPRERVLAAEPDASGAPVVATTLALYHREPSAEDEIWRRLGLESIGRLRWDPDRGVLDLTSFAAGPVLRLTLQLKRGTRIGTIVKERVAAMLIVGTRVPLDNGGTALVTARRHPGGSEVIWVVLLDDNADPTDAATHACVDSAIRELRAHAGL